MTRARDIFSLLKISLAFSDSEDYYRSTMHELELDIRSATDKLYQSRLILKPLGPAFSTYVASIDELISDLQGELKTINKNKDTQ